MAKQWLHMMLFYIKESLLMRFVLTLVAASALLVACGGSDDNDEQVQQPPAPVNPGTPTIPDGLQGPLSSANFVPVAQASLASNDYLLNASSFFSGAEVAESSALVQFAQQQVRQFARRSPAPAQAVGVVQIDEEACSKGGKIVFEDNDANNNGIADRGDSAIITAYNCSEYGAVLNGRIQLALQSSSGDPEGFPYSISASATYVNFSATAAGMTMTGNGTMAFSERWQSESAYDISSSIPSFVLTTVVDGKSLTQTLKNYAISLTARPSGNLQLYTSSVDGTLVNSVFGPQSFTVKTVQPFVRLSSERYARQGELRITDNTRAQVRAKVANASTVTIDLDANGDGNYETGVNRLWSDML